MLQADRANGSLGRITHCRTVRACLSLLPIVIVHGPRDVSCAANLTLRGKYASCAEQQCRCWGCAEREVEGAVGADGDSGGDGCAWIVVGCAGVEFLFIGSAMCLSCSCNWVSYFAEIHALHTFAT